MTIQRTELGCIKSVSVGMGGYQDAMFGVSFTLGGKSWGVDDFWGTWAPGVVDPSERSARTESERQSELARTCERLCKLLAEAKVGKVANLKGTPVEVTFDGMTLSSWRVLTEVLP